MQSTQRGNYEYVIKYCEECEGIEKRTIRRIGGEVIAEVPGYFHGLQDVTWEEREKVMGEFEEKLERFWRGLI